MRFITSIIVRRPTLGIAYIEGMNCKLGKPRRKQGRRPRHGHDLVVEGDVDAEHEDHHVGDQWCLEKGFSSGSC
jgi:hypothetical protein